VAVNVSTRIDGQFGFIDQDSAVAVGEKGM